MLRQIICQPFVRQGIIIGKINIRRPSTNHLRRSQHPLKIIQFIRIKIQSRSINPVCFQHPVSAILCIAGGIRRCCNIGSGQVFQSTEQRISAICSRNIAGKQINAAAVFDHIPNILPEIQLINILHQGSGCHSFLCRELQPALICAVNRKCNGIGLFPGQSILYHGRQIFQICGIGIIAQHQHIISRSITQSLIICQIR